MKEFNIYWKEIVDMRICIEAKNKKDALKQFKGGNIDWGGSKEDGGEIINDSIEVFEERD